MDENKDNQSEIDLSGMLNNSRSGVNNEEELIASGSYYGEVAGSSKIIRWVIGHSGGLIKDERGANYFLLGFAAVAIIISLVLSFGGRLSVSENKAAEKKMLEIHPELIR